MRLCYLQTTEDRFSRVEAHAYIPYFLFCFLHAVFILVIFTFKKLLQKTLLSVDALCPSQQFFSHVSRFSCLFGLNQ